MSTLSTDEIIELCKQLGPYLKVPNGINGTKLMIAIGAVESGGSMPRYIGHDCGPNFEKAYFTDGAIYNHNSEQKELVAKFGPLGASSFGPWQMMLINFSDKETASKNMDPHFFAVEFVRFFNSFVMGVRHPTTIEEIGEVWNLGHVGSDPDYVKKLLKAYNEVSI